MATYAALLRGINVGGKNIIKMADLRKMFEALGFTDVQTYIQSGNVLFRSNEGEDALRKRIEPEILNAFKIPVTVILRTASELEQIVSNCPFSEKEISEAEASTDTECLYVACMPQAPSKENIELLNTFRSEMDEFRIIGRDIYLLFHHSIRDSKLASNLQKLNTPATVRNWKTITKLASLAGNL